jgi:hypothetical protein
MARDAPPALRPRREAPPAQLGRTRAAALVRSGLGPTAGSCPAAPLSFLPEFFEEKFLGESLFASGRAESGSAGLAHNFGVT